MALTHQGVIAARKEMEKFSVKVINIRNELSKLSQALEKPELTSWKNTGFGKNCEKEIISIEELLNSLVKNFEQLEQDTNEYLNNTNQLNGF